MGQMTQPTCPGSWYIPAHSTVVLIHFNSQFDTRLTNNYQPLSIAFFKTGSQLTASRFSYLQWHFSLVTRSQLIATLMANSKSALTDHANQANHTIDWKKTTSSTENKTVLPGGSRKLYISARKVIELWIETRAVISWVTPTTAFLMRQLIVASTLGRTEYQLLRLVGWLGFNGTFNTE